MLYAEQCSVKYYAGYMNRAAITAGGKKAGEEPVDDYKTSGIYPRDSLLIGYVALPRLWNNRSHRVSGRWRGRTIETGNAGQATVIFHVFDQTEFSNSIVIAKAKCKKNTRTKAGTLFCSYPTNWLQLCEHDSTHVKYVSREMKMKLWYMI